MSRIVTIDIRVRAELSDRLPLALLSVDTNIEVPLKMVEITGPTSVCVTRVLPKVLTVQHGMHEDEGRQFEPLGTTIPDAPLKQPPNVGVAISEIVSAIERKAPSALHVEERTRIAYEILRLFPHILPENMRDGIPE